MNILYSIFAILISLAIGHLIFNLIGGLTASLYGMLTLTILLSIKVINAEKMTASIQWSIRNMGVCFVPAGVGIMQYYALIKQYGLHITLIVITTTLFLIALVAWLYIHLVEHKKQ